jgi:hypothetical protein
MLFFVYKILIINFQIIRDNQFNHEGNVAFEFLANYLTFLTYYLWLVLYRFKGYNWAGLYMFGSSFNNF